MQGRALSSAHCGVAVGLRRLGSAGSGTQLGSLRCSSWLEEVGKGSVGHSLSWWREEMLWENVFVCFLQHLDPRWPLSLANVLQGSEATFVGNQ